MENQATKTEYFEYFIDQIYSLNDNVVPNDLSLVKTQKLLFFLTTAVEDEDGGLPLLNIFNNFHALPYGHVESDVYTAMKNNNLSFYQINRFGAKKLTSEPLVLADNVTELIDTGVKELMSYNLISRNASYLVNLSHCYESWIKNYRLALSQKKSSQLIPESDIMADQKYFAL